MTICVTLCPHTLFWQYDEEYNRGKRQICDHIKITFSLKLSYKKIRAFLLIRPKKHFKNEQRSKDAAAKKRSNTSGVGKINNYYEDIYIPPYNNTD